MINDNKLKLNAPDGPILNTMSMYSTNVISSKCSVPTKCVRRETLDERMRSRYLRKQREGVDAPLLQWARMRTEAPPLLHRMRPRQEPVVGEAEAHRFLCQHHHLFEGRFQAGQSPDPADGS